MTNNTNNEAILKSNTQTHKKKYTGQSTIKSILKNKKKRDRGEYYSAQILA